ncbi:GNAT family N-acetyltransferase [Devosia nitrariae]
MREGPVEGLPAVDLLHTWQLSKETLFTIRRLLEETFDGQFSEEDWDHTLGGVHALVWEDGQLIGHGSLVQRRLIHTWRAAGGPTEPLALRTGYLEAMAVRADRRRQGIGGAIIRALGDVVQGAYALGALSASDDGLRFYAAHGWQRWQGRTFALTPFGVERTQEEDAGIFVLPVVEVDLFGDLTCDWRDGDVW